MRHWLRLFCNRAANMLSILSLTFCNGGGNCSPASSSAQTSGDPPALVGGKVSTIVENATQAVKSPMTVSGDRLLP